MRTGLAGGGGGGGRGGRGLREKVIRGKRFQCGANRGLICAKMRF